MTGQLRRFAFVVLVVSLTVLFGGCAVQQQTDTLVEESGEGRVEELAFYDSRNFDSSLSDALAGEPSQVIVKPTAAFSLNEIPERIDKWLFVVQDSGGTVSSKEEPEEALRGVSAGINVAMVVAKYVIEKRTFSKAKEYNVTLYHDVAGMVHKVVFEKR